MEIRDLNSADIIVKKDNILDFVEYLLKRSNPKFNIRKALERFNIDINAFNMKEEKPEKPNLVLIKFKD